MRKRGKEKQEKMNEGRKKEMQAREINEKKKKWKSVCGAAR